MKILTGKALSILTLSITTLSITTFSIKKTKQKPMLMLSFALLTTICAEYHNKVHYSECRYAEFCYAECHGVYARASFTMKKGFKSAPVHLE
jgi:hypothetical protein